MAGNPPPEYPMLARRRGQQGQVLVRLEVAADGTAARAEVVRSSGVAALDRAARAAVARWRFQPARRGGRAVGATVEVPVVFRLDGRG
jgi:protein TonB